MANIKNISSTPKDKRFVDVTRDRDYIHYYDYVITYVLVPYNPMLQGSNNFRGWFS